MASEAAEAPELSALFERLMTRHRDLSLFIPFILGFANAAATQNPDEETPQTRSPSERIILINPFTQGMVVIEGGAASFDALMRELGSKNGQPPASKASIDAMPSVVISENECKDGGECVICLEEWELGKVVKEMPCEHKFHPNCIEKWLKIHGSCPVCRFKMPVDEEEVSKKREVGEDEGRSNNNHGREIWVSFSVNGNRGINDSGANEMSASSQSDDHQMEG